MIRFTQCEHSALTLQRAVWQSKAFHSPCYFGNDALFHFLTIGRIRAGALLAYTRHGHIHSNKLISVGIHHLITIGNRESKTNLFVPYFIFMRLLIKRFDWHPWYMVSAFLRSSWGLSSPLRHLHSRPQSIVARYHSPSCIVMNCTLGDF